MLDARGEVRENILLTRWSVAVADDRSFKNVSTLVEYMKNQPNPPKSQRTETNV